MFVFKSKPLPSPSDVVKPSAGMEARAILFTALMAVADGQDGRGGSIESELREPALNIVAVVCFFCKVALTQIPTSEQGRLYYT